MTFKELRGVLGSDVILVLKFNETEATAQAMSDCDEVLKGFEDYEVLDMELHPNGYDLYVLLDRPKEAKK